LVRAPWHAAAQGVPEVMIDPGQAFGTGAHPTTRLCLELLLGVEPSGPLVDVGCGSGVLAIAAAKLGWAPVVGLDHEPEAVAATRIVATPHVGRVDVHELPDRVHELRAALLRENIPLAVECGGELKPRSVFSLGQDDLEVIAQGPPGRRWLLYEVPFRGVEELFLEGARELRRRGFGLVCAHPERSQGLLSGGLTALAPVLE